MPPVRLCRPNHADPFLDLPPPLSVALTGTFGLAAEAGLGSVVPSGTGQISALPLPDLTSSLYT
jgi:hypothetical protein